MSIPPQIIRVKRKAVDDETPVTFLQFEEGVKRARSSTNWIYQRRHSKADPTSPARRQDTKPVIQVSKPPVNAATASDNAALPSSTSQTTLQHGDTSPSKTASEGIKRRSLSPRKTISPRPSMQRLGSTRASEPRRFHLSRSFMTLNAGSTGPSAPAVGGVSKKNRNSPAVFVERSRKKLASRAQQGLEKKQTVDMDAEEQVGSSTQAEMQPQPERKLKKPTTRAKPTRPDVPAPAPLPERSFGSKQEEMETTAFMDQWTMDVIGANLQEMDRERQRESRFKPKAPAQRYHERHPEQAANPANDKPDTTMADEPSDDGEDSDYIIEEYVRVPANVMSSDVNPGDVGVIVLDGKEDDILFFGPEHDEDDDYLEDDEDENAENHYTADYPEEEVDSDDEYNRHAYLYRTGNASDDEEFDNDRYGSDEDEDGMVMEGDVDDDDVAMARIRNYIRRRDADAEMT